MFVLLIVLGILGFVCLLWIGVKISLKSLENGEDLEDDESLENYTVETVDDSINK